MSKAFQVLGLDASASPHQVKEAWRLLASIHHPDKGGDPVEFDRFRKAYKEALAEAETPKPCIKCSGSGKIQHVNGWTKIDLPCDRCGGSGYDGDQV